MFLRRISEHLKTQNWTAIGIELVIVIVGVFLGAQASNWNEQRQERDGERVYLSRLADHMTGDVAEMRGKNAYVSAVLAASRRTDRFISEGRPCSGDCWTVLADFFIASQWQDLAPRGGVFEGLQASVYPYDLELKRDLVQHYSLIHEGARLIPPSAYRERVRMLIPLTVQEGLWVCNLGFGTTQAVAADCPAVITDAQAGAIVERLRRDELLRGQLTYSASMLVTAVKATGGWMKESDPLVARVRRAAG